MVASKIKTHVIKVVDYMILSVLLQYASKVKKCLHACEKTKMFLLRVIESSRFGDWKMP